MLYFWNYFKNVKKKYIANLKFEMDGWTLHGHELVSKTEHVTSTFYSIIIQLTLCKTIILKKTEIAPWNRFKPSSKIVSLTVPRWYFFCGSFVLFCVLCFSCFRVCSLLPCGHQLGKSWPLGSYWRCLLYFCYFLMWYPGSGVVLDCIVSWYLPSFLLSRPIIA